MREPRPRNPVAREVSSDRSLQVFIKSQQELITSEPVLARALLLMQMSQKDDEFYKRWRAARRLGPTVCVLRRGLPAKRTALAATMPNS